MKPICTHVFSLGLVLGLFAFLAFGVGFARAQTDKGLFIQRVIHPDDDASNGFTQKGSVAFTPATYDNTSAHTVGWWARRVFDNSVTLPTGGSGSTVSYDSNTTPFGSTRRAVNGSHVPQDEDWHYFYITFNGDGQVRLYRDGVRRSNTGGYLDLLSFSAATFHSGEGAVTQKGPTVFNTIIDEVTVWDSISSELLELHNNIYKYGMVAMPDSHPNRVAWWNCDSEASVLEYYEDTSIIRASATGDSRRYRAERIFPPPLIDVPEKPAQFIIVTIETEFGADKVTPTVAESGDFDFGATVLFQAPEFVYFDRYKNELNPTPANIRDFAFYRARNIGFATKNGATDIQGTDRFFEIPLTENIAVEWKWELEYAVVVDSATEGIEGLDPSLGNPVVNGAPIESQNRVGKHWVVLNTLVSTAIDGILDNTSSGAAGSGIRFSMKDYILENAPGDPGHCIALSRENNDYIDAGFTGIDLTSTSFTLEFWARLDPSAANSDQNILSFGDVNGARRQLRTGFRSDGSGNRFFALANNVGAALELAEGFTDNFWHHWAVVYDQSNTEVLVYRDGMLVGSVNHTLVFTGSDHLTIGARNRDGTRTHHFPGSLDNVRVWTDVRSESEIRDSMVTDTMGPQANLALELTFDAWSSGSDFDVTSTDGSDLVVTLTNTAGVFPASATQEDKEAALFPEFRFTDVIDPSSRIQTDDFTIQDWVRVTWRWDKEFKMDVNVNDPDFADLPFITTIDGAFTGADLDNVWVPELTEVTVGTLYRTLDRCNTLKSVDGAINVFAGVSFDGLDDAVFNSRAARQFTIEAIDNPGALTFSFDRTLFRAIVPLGEGLDASTTASANIQLIPNLCEGGELHLNAGTPPIFFSNFDRHQPGDSGTVGQSGRQILWDAVGKQLLPLQPGSFQVEWPDANDPELAYLIHVVTDFPLETRGVSWDLEDEEGFRIDTSSARILDSGNEPARAVDMASVSDAFPASPLAHYRHLYRAVDAPPVDLDVNEADRWKFDELTWSTATVVTPAENTSFTAATEGRSLLLFSYTPDPTSVAVGDATVEAFVTRIVDARDIATQTESNEVLSAGQRGALQLDGSANSYLAVTNLSQYAFSNDATLDVTVEAWVNLSVETSANEAEQVLFDNQHDGSTLTVGLRSQNHAGNPGGWFMDYTASVGSVESIDFPEIPASVGWHHLAITVQLDQFRIHLDGNLMGEEAGPVTVSPLWRELRVGQSSAGANGLIAQVDNLRVWDPSIGTTEIREAMFRRRAASTARAPIVEIDFDSGISDGMVAQSGTEVNLVATVPGTPLVSLLDIPDEDAHLEVASRIQTKLDTARFGSGYLLNEVANYNAEIYDREAGVGAWHGIYPVNWSGIFSAQQALDVTWYENPYQTIPASTNILHPNVAWPYTVFTYSDVNFPTFGKDKDNRIYIASRIGTEGVDENGNPQRIFDPSLFTLVSVYNQPNILLPGFNPNEEHAFLRPSILDQLTGNNDVNLGQDSAFALQRNINRTDKDNPDLFTSEPWVLVQFQNLESEEFEMSAYEVQATRTSGTEDFPALDPVTHQSTDPFGVPVAQPANPNYRFKYPSFAGDVVIPPYPLNLMIGNVVLSESYGGNTSLTNFAQRTLWKDINENHWVVSGDSSFFFRYWYPFRPTFWFDTDDDTESDLDAGTPIAWLPEVSTNTMFLSDGDPSTVATDEPAQPVLVEYNTYWRDDYPILKRGESVTYVGGENKAENPADEGLPGIVGFAAAQLVYDSTIPTMLINSNNVDIYGARIVRPLDWYGAELSQDLLPDAINPADTEKVMVVGSRWYFPELTGSLQKRFYYGTLAGKLFFRGRLNDLEVGDPSLTATPVSLSILEPNVMTVAEFQALQAIGEGDSTWNESVEEIFSASQDPHDIHLPVDTTTQRYYSGVESNSNGFVEQPSFYFVDADEGTSIELSDTDLGDVLKLFLGIDPPEDPDTFQPLNSLGVGAALVPNPTLLTQDSSQPIYVTIAENNHPDAGGAVSLHIIQIGDARFRGAIKVVEARNVFSEKINLRHTGDFGGNTENVYYQWWVRDVIRLDDVGLPGEDEGWQIYEEGLGLHQIQFGGRPDIVLADKFFFVRYGQDDEFTALTNLSNVVTNDLDLASVEDASWRLIDINSVTDTWVRAEGDMVPYQWAGANNSPQLQADGSRRYIPQLVMGWIKRVLDRINLYEARFNDFYNNESPATYSSMIQMVGNPFIGKVALNSDKDVIENVGLIELYETVLARGKELTLDIPGAATDGTNQALLLAATRLAFLYELLAREAYSDAQNPLIRISGENGLGPVASYVHAFYNSQATLLDEELALLRGTDFLVAYPAFNRLFWNYVKGEGEAAYNANYNIYDVNTDGFINEFDAAELYPQGHGDSWGHFVSANNMHYELLGNNAFDWEARSELYSLLDNVIEADYLDEKSFSRIASAKARAGLEIVKATYRRAYTQDPDGQWQGYTDADPARAWGVSEWAKRTEHAAIFDWAMGNAIVPRESGEDLDSLDVIDRRGNRAELSEIAAVSRSIQVTLDGANNGKNPLGFHQDALVFDLDPLQIDGSPEARNSHFEQVFDRAIGASQNALAAMDFAARSDRQLQRIADDTLSLQTEALHQDMEFRNRLIEIFGRPYDGTIGPGQVYPEGHLGPDTLLFLYIDQTDTAGLSPGASTRYVTLTDTNEADGSLDKLAANYKSVDFDPNFANLEDDPRDIFDRFYLSEDFGEDPALNFSVPITTAQYAFQAEPDWGRRLAYGRIQMILLEMLTVQTELEQGVRDYAAYIEQIELEAEHLDQWLRAQSLKEDVRSAVFLAQTIDTALLAIFTATETYNEWAWNLSWQAGLVAKEFLPLNAGLSSDLTSTPRGAIKALSATISSFSGTAWTIGALGRVLTEGALEALAAAEVSDIQFIEEFKELNGLTKDLGVLLTQEESKRLGLAKHAQRFQQLAAELQSAQAEGFRLLDEREAFNMTVAAKAQRNRYQDLMLRMTRNESMQKYQDALENALRYAWLAAKAYDYETSLDVSDPAAATTLLEDIVKTRSLGLWNGDAPQIGQGGLAEHLAVMSANFDALKGQLGINNPQLETGYLSLRHENFRILRNRDSSDERWQAALQRSRVADLWDLEEFRQYCRPFADPSDGPQPAIVIEFPTEIVAGHNVFGKALGSKDHAYSSANFATKIRSVGTWFEGYEDAELAITPRVYLVPVGADVLRIANSDLPQTRMWNMVEQRVPIPFVINESNLNNAGFIPSIDGLDGSFADLKRVADFRAYPTGGAFSIDPAQLHGDSRLVGRSVWNTRWLLIIPGVSLHADAEFGLQQFVEYVDDIKLVFETYTHSGN